MEKFVRTRFSNESNSLFQPIIKKKKKKTAKMLFEDKVERSLFG